MSNLLSEYEIRLVADANILLAKNRIIKKVYELLGVVAEKYKTMLQISEIRAETGREAKISKGENYRGLPYVVLDYPRLFDKTNVFAIRTLFWWGNFFSITLQLAGRYREEYEFVIQKAIDQNQLNGWYLGCAAEPWEHHFEQDNYKQIELGSTCFLYDLSQIKIAKKISLDKWDEVDLFLTQNFAVLMQLLASSGTDTME